MEICEFNVLAGFQSFNHEYFNDELPIPKLVIRHTYRTLGYFHCDLDAWGGIVNPIIEISDNYDYTESQFRDILVHEMIHYYILLNGIRDTSKHGQVFRRMMNDINQKYGRHISISHRSTKEELPEDTREQPVIICLTQMKSGETGITVCARTRIFQIYRELPVRFDIAKMTWYYVVAPYFRRYPRSIKAKVYRVDMNELKPHLENAVEMECDGHRMTPKRVDS